LGAGAVSPPPLVGPGVQQTVPLDKTVFDAQPAALVRISGIRLPSFGTGAAEISVRYGGSLPAGRQYFYQVQQWVRNRLVGGSVYQVTIAGTKKVSSLPGPGEDEDGETPIRNDPLWARKAISNEIKRQSKSS